MKTEAGELLWGISQNGRPLSDNAFVGSCKIAFAPVDWKAARQNSAKTARWAVTMTGCLQGSREISRRG